MFGGQLAKNALHACLPLPAPLVPARCACAGPRVNVLPPPPSLPFSWRMAAGRDAGGVAGRGRRFRAAGVRRGARAPGGGALGGAHAGSRWRAPRGSAVGAARLAGAAGGDAEGVGQFLAVHSCCVMLYGRRTFDIRMHAKCRSRRGGGATLQGGGHTLPPSQPSPTSPMSAGTAYWLAWGVRSSAHGRVHRNPAPRRADPHRPSPQVCQD